ncbi:5-oxoprolinase subunit PxpB [Lysinibacillus telephonicus]|uniref:5-oxoprolinase subunit PxpB n=1 Tax=Lysinibacillus telephonicus TaxID=1714840 RepID=A0A431UTL0_9BACI|nr:5-oxoprolinase subunit PxpB [Lysinibacillus telephonicus]
MNVIPVISIQDKTIASFIFGQEINLSTFQLVTAFDQFINKNCKRYIIETVPSYHMVTVFFNRTISSDLLTKEILAMWEKYPVGNALNTTKQITIPVCYEEPFALDLDRVSKEINLSKEQIIEKHCEPLYTVFFIGFLPGFPYLGGLQKDLYIPRLEIPRKNVQKGSVGIGGQQTGIYPVDSPGGWNIIGKTPIDLFNVKRKHPFLLQAGNQLKFEKISKEQFDELEQQLSKDSEYVFELLKMN